MNCQAQTRRPRAWRRLTTDEENWLQYPVPSPDLIRTVSMLCACAFLAIAPSLPCEERFMYQIHIPLPASGLFLASVALVWDEAPPTRGPAARARRSAAAIRASVVVRRRARMNSRLRVTKHPTAGKAASGVC